MGSAGRVLALVCALALMQSPPERVTVGAHLRNIEVINLEENSYSASFILWATWKGERDPTKGLRFVNLLEAWALTMIPVYEEPLLLPDGRKYQRFVGEGRFFHKFELASFPLDSQEVVLELEDAQHAETELVPEADPASSLAPDLKIPGWTVRKPVLEVAHITYPGALGLPVDGAHSRVRFGVTLERPWRVFFVTMFPPIALVMMCCWFIFFLRPIHVEARVGTAVTALLTIVFLQLAFTDDLPYLGTTVLLDQVFNFSYAVITAGSTVFLFAFYELTSETSFPWDFAIPRGPETPLWSAWGTVAWLSFCGVLVAHLWHRRHVFSRGKLSGHVTESDAPCIGATSVAEV